MCSSNRLRIKASLILLSCLALSGISATVTIGGIEVPDFAVRKWESEYQELQGQAVSGLGKSRVDRHKYLDQHVTLWDTDRDALEVVLRRTEALYNNLSRMQSSKAISSFGDRLSYLRQKASGVGLSKTAASARKDIFMEACAVRRQLALSNPLLDDFNEILYANHGPGILIQSLHYGFLHNGGGLRILSGFKEGNPQTRDLLQNSVVQNGRLQGQTLEGGAFYGAELSYDGQTVLFAWCEKKGNAVYLDPQSMSIKHPHFADDEHYTSEEFTITDAGPGRYPPDGEQRIFVRATQGQSFHIFKVNIDGSNLIQLTDGRHNDYDPCWLPNGRIAFVSDRRGAGVRCHVNNMVQFCGTLYSMKDDGNDIIPLSYHETSEVYPSVDNNGKIVYTRWDYVDRDFNVAHHIWTCNPDGTDPRAPHGNYPYPHSTLDQTEKVAHDGRFDRPWSEFFIRAIPGTHSKYVACASTHHGNSSGSLVLINTAIKDDYKDAQVQRISPGDCFPNETPGSAPNFIDNCNTGPSYVAPWPLSEDYYIAVRRSDPGGIYLIDKFGNEELLLNCDGEKTAFPVPIRSREKLPVISTKTWQGERRNADDHKRATVSVVNVYEADFDWPANTTIKELRIIQIIPKPWFCPIQNEPFMGWSHGGIGRMVLGTAPVEEDGSAYFEAPVEREFYIQAIDEKGMAVQSMRSGTYVHPGEQLSCMGCHEDKWKAIPPLSTPPAAFQRAPSPLTPEVEGSLPLTFARLVAPVLKNKCMGCHVEKNVTPDFTQSLEETESPEKGDAVGTLYNSLKDYAFYFHAAEWNDGLGKTHGGYRTIAGRFGTRESQLGKTLLGANHQQRMQDGRFTEEDLHRIILWLDCNSMELAANYDADKQRRGEVVWPYLDVDPDNPTGVEYDRPLPGEAVILSKLDMTASPVIQASPGIRLVNKNLLRIENKTPGTLFVSLHDCTGRKLCGVAADPNRRIVDIDLATIRHASGVYVVRVKRGNDIFAESIMLH
ncbi:MAG: hypothetical protein GF350_15305 [Chitinivibrionales bacterium]|nr:hypothetical protein [Chitinivibrionales bacterium]